MQQPPYIFDTNAISQRHKRAQNDALFLHDLARDEILSRTKDVNRSFTTKAVVTPYPQIWANTGATIISPTEVLDVEEGQFDLIVHALCLHQFNDPLGQIIQCRRALKPDGFFLAATFGGETLATFRQVMTVAEATVTGGASPRVCPMVDIRDYGSLLQRSRLALPVTDNVLQSVSYRDVTHLMHDLRAMGEANPLAGRVRTFTNREIFKAANNHYPRTDDRISADFDMIYLAGWAPHESQQTPLRPGSAQVSLIDALNVDESLPND